MSDGSSGNFGDALENMTTQSAKAIGGTITDFKNSAKGQVMKGSGAISGSFTPGASAQQQNPNTAPGLQGGDLFSPDMVANKPKPAGSTPQGQKTLTQSAQQGGQDPDTKTPEEAQKIQKIEQELRSMHKQYFDEFLAKAEGRDRKTVVEKQNKDQEEQGKKMEDLQQKEEKKQADNASLQRAKQGVENKGGGAG